MNEDYVRDGFGNIDDFRAPAGMVGMQLSRQIMLQSMLAESVVPQLHELKNHGFCKKTIFDVFLQTIESVYEDTVPTHANVREWRTGDLVKHRGTQQFHLITKIELLGSEKIYLSEFPPEQVVDPVHLELVNESSSS